MIIIAIILTIAAAISGGADLVNQSDEAVIGTLTRSVLNALKTEPTTKPAPTDPGSVDAAVVTLNGNRGLTSAIFTVLDAASGEASTTPIETLGGEIDTPGTILTNAQLNAIFQNLADNPGRSVSPGRSARLQVGLAERHDLGSADRGGEAGCSRAGLRTMAAPCSSSTN